MFESKPLVEFYSSLNSEKFQNLKKIARKMFVLFASTYICEQTFSIMKVNKSKTRSLLTDSNLQSVLRISTSNLAPNFNKLVKSAVRYTTLIDIVLLLTELLYFSNKCVSCEVSTLIY